MFNKSSNLSPVYTSSSPVSLFGNSCNTNITDIIKNIFNSLLLSLLFKRFFNTKPFDYSIHNREICSCLCETAPSSEPYFISDIKGRLLARSSCCRRPHRIFPWSNYLLNLTRNCGQKHYRINVSSNAYSTT